MLWAAEHDVPIVYLCGATLGVTAPITGAGLLVVMLPDDAFTAAELTAMGYEIGPTQTPIIPLLIGPMDVTFQVWRHALDAGVFTNPVVPPAVPEGGCRLRTSFMATHTDEQLDFVLDILEQAGKKYGVL